jgi:hypothetical protein
LDAQFFTEFSRVALKTARVENDSRLQPVADLIEPESFQPLEADVQLLEILAADIADGFDRFEMAVEQLGDDIAIRSPSRSGSHGPSGGRRRTFVVDVTDSTSFFRLYETLEPR